MNLSACKYLFCLFSCSYILLVGNAMAMGEKPKRVVDPLCGDSVASVSEVPGSERIYGLRFQDLAVIASSNISNTLLNKMYSMQDGFNYAFHFDGTQRVGNPKEAYEALLFPKLKHFYELKYSSELESKNSVLCQDQSATELDYNNIVVDGDGKGATMQSAPLYFDVDLNKNLVTLRCVSLANRDPESMRQEFCQKSIACALTTTDLADRAQIENERVKHSCNRPF